MKALVSGQSGVAVAVDGEECYIIRPPGFALSVCPQSTAYRLLEGSNDVKVLGDVDVDSVISELQAARARDTAFQFTLVLLDGLEQTELRQSILDRLRRLILFWSVGEFILNRLYAAPLNSAARDNARAILVESRDHPVANLLDEVLRNQGMIANTRSAWDNIRCDAFDSQDEKNECFFVLLERGVVRELAVNPDADLGDQGNEKHKEVIRSWREAAGTTRSRSVQSIQIQAGPATISTTKPQITSGNIAGVPSISYTRKRDLAKREIQTRFQRLKDDLDAKIQLEKNRVRSNEGIALVAVVAYNEGLVHQVRDEFTRTLQNWGLPVRADQLRVITDFSKQLAKFKRELTSRNFDRSSEKIILHSMDAAFEKVKQQLGDFVRGEVVHASEKGEAHVRTRRSTGRISEVTVLDRYLLDARQFTRTVNYPSISHPDDLPREVVGWADIEIISIDDIEIGDRR